MKKDLEKVKKIKRLKYILPVILIVLIVFMSALVLIGRRPPYYAPLRLNDKNLISPYLTGQILPTVYNNSQLGKPFELVITQDGLNDIVARLPQPIALHNVNLTDPQVILSPMQITLMATVKIKPLNPILTIELNPYINQHGLLNLCVNRVMLGSADITTIAMSIGNKAYSNWLYSTGTDPNDIAAQICRSLLNNEPFEPTFEVGDTTLHITKFDTAAKKITVLLTPVPN
jgi:uncharacterized protein YpmS